MEPNINFMAVAVRLATNNVLLNKGGPFGAVVVKNGHIVGRGANSVTRTNDPTAHGEVVAIRDACKNLKTFDLSGCELYTSAECCPMCLSASYWAKLDKVYYACTSEEADAAGFSDKFLYKEFLLTKEKRALPTICVRTSDALSAFNAWSKSPNRIVYGEKPSANCK